MAILLHPRQDAREWRARFESGTSLDRTPYGYDRAQQWFDLVWSETRNDSRVLRVLRGWCMSWLGFDFLHAWYNRRLLLGADVIWTHTEREHLAVALLQVLRPRCRRVPVVAQSVWLWDSWTGAGPIRRGLISVLLRTQAVELVHSRLNLEDSRAAVPGRRVELVPFGSAPAVLSGPAPTGAEPRVNGRPLLLAVGNDADRDWPLLSAVARLMPEVEVRVASKSGAARAVDWPANVTLRPADSVAELRDLYLNADVVALPLRPNRHASGATVCIEALAACRRIVATQAGGIQDYLGGEGKTVEPGDVMGFAAAIRAAIREEFPAPTSHAYLKSGLTQGDYVGRYVLVTRALLGDALWPPSISAFAPVGLLDPNP